MKAHTALIRGANNAKSAKNIQTVPTRRLRTQARARKSKQGGSYIDGGERVSFSMGIFVTPSPPLMMHCNVRGKDVYYEQSTNCDSSIIRD